MILCQFQKDQNSSIAWQNIITSQQQPENNNGNKIFQAGLLKQLQIFYTNFDRLEEYLQISKCQEFQKSITDQSSNKFKQQWQNIKIKNQNSFGFSYFFRQNIINLIFNIILLVIYLILIWSLSVFRVFGDKNSKYVFILCLITQIMDAIIKSTFYVLVKFKKQSVNILKDSVTDIIQMYLSNIFCIFYSVLGLSSLIDSVEAKSYFILDIVAIGLNYHRVQQILKDIKMMKVIDGFKNYIKLFTMMGTLIMIIHVFAVLMFASTSFNEPHYLDHIQNENTDWLELYVYSFYFSGTTVLTVGYGDILPKNIVEIFIVLLMQIFGVVMIVYLNGQVGNILSSLRKDKENLQNDLSVLERLKDNFKLSLYTTQKIRQYLINNRRLDQQSSFQQQSQLLSKINSDLREEATMTNHISVIKKSVYFLTNFTLKAQVRAANKLIHRMYSPDEKIVQTVGNQKLYFIKNGQVSFYICQKQSENQHQRKIIQNVAVSNLDQSSGSKCNSFGYVGLITGKPNRLKMFSKDFSSLFWIDKNSFLQVIKGDSKDFQKYHELREFYLTEKQPEKYEAELFYNQNDHYTCNQPQLIESYLKLKAHSNRKRMLRGFKRRKLVVQTEKQDYATEISQSQKSSALILNDQYDEADSKNNLNPCLTIQQRKNKYKSLNTNDSSDPIKYRVNLRKNGKKTTIKVQPFQKYSNQQSISIFQTGISFNYFHTQFNLDQVMRKVNYHTKVLAIFTNMFQNTLRRVNKESLNTDQSLIIKPANNILNYRRQKDFRQSINIKF